jgi:hypothetical protein
MKKTWKDTINNTEVNFTIEVKNRKTEFDVTGIYSIEGIVTKFRPLSMTIYNETSLVENLPRFEANLWEKAATMVRGKQIEDVSTKLKKLGYE